MMNKPEMDGWMPSDGECPVADIEMSSLSWFDVILIMMALIIVAALCFGLGYAVSAGVSCKATTAMLVGSAWR